MNKQTLSEQLRLIIYSLGIIGLITVISIFMSRGTVAKYIKALDKDYSKETFYTEEQIGLSLFMPFSLQNFFIYSTIAPFCVVDISFLLLSSFFLILFL